MTDVTTHTDSWETLPWKRFQYDVARLQTRIYRASRQDERAKVHQLQRLLLRNKAAKYLAVRTVTQDNRGKRTAGVDGKASLNPQERLALVQELNTHLEPSPVRRVNIPKGDGETRPLGIPTLRDRALQALVKLALEPEWEARFEPNSYGFRPGRSAHDAIEAIFNSVRYKAKYVLDADIEKCFDCINHDALLAKLATIRPIERLVRGWLKAGIIDQGNTVFPEAGTPQGGVISPLLANIALHGLEAELTRGHQRVGRPAVIRYADDFVVLHHDLNVISELKARAEAFLQTLGLRLKPSKTSITHTLTRHEGRVGFDFLGFNVRQYPRGKHHSARNGKGMVLGFKTLIRPSKASVQEHEQSLKTLFRTLRNAPAEALIQRLGAKIRGWTNYYATVASSTTFNDIDSRVYAKAIRWVRWRHKGSVKAAIRANFDYKWRLCRGESVLQKHIETHIKRHVKVKGDKSPFDGDWIYWASRLGRDPRLPTRVTALLKRQKGRCKCCDLLFTYSDILEVHHQDGNHRHNAYENLALLHGHCHDDAHRGAHDKG